MEEKDAIKVLIDVAHLAQSKGILTLQDASIVIQAIGMLQDPVEGDASQELSIVEEE